MTFLNLVKSFCVLVIGITVAGCSAPQQRPAALSPQQIYDATYRDGGRDAVDLLREGMRSRQVYGVADPYIPLRTPDEVVPVWIPDYVDVSGRRISGHWQHTVVRRSQWYTE